jgi:mitogen-activated protein kinase 1/3
MQAEKASMPLEHHQAQTQRYRLESEIGSGTYGTVFKALDTHSGNKVAIKWVGFSGYTNPDFFKCFSREVKFNIDLTKLKGNIFTPKLKEIYFPIDADPANYMSVEGVYIVTEYYSYNLDKVLYESSTPLTEEQVKIVSYNLLCAIHFLHSANVIHRAGQHFADKRLVS